jgi:UDP-N-acetylmuramoyl-tripeptide--D-alanyl-D-alanine ligase
LTSVPQELVLTPATIAAAINGELIGQSANGTIQGFSIDTRTIQAGDLFFAIRGDRFDGHVFVADALRAGSIGAVVSDRQLARTLTEDGAVALIVVTDTIAALQALGHHVRRASGAAVVAVTGSAGKSTTKEMTADFLSARYRVFRNRGNLNNHIGLPLSLLELRRKPDIGVFELGMNHFGEISALVRITEPEVRVWTNVGPAHLEFFGTVDAIAEAKAEILEGADKDSLLVANADDDRVVRHAAKFGGRVRTFGVERPADVRALAVRDLGIDGTAALVRTPIGEAEIRTPLPGTANLSNLLATTCPSPMSSSVRPY